MADINGLQVDGDAPLTEGQILEIPDRQTNENRFDNFKPDSIIDKIGSTTPTLPYIPPPQEAGCNALASIIIIVVAIVVTVYTAGAAAGVTGATTTTTAGTAAATGSAATAGAAGSAVSFGAAGAASTTFAAGSAALGGSLGLQGAIAAGIGGFAGSLAGQAVGNILGVQDGFSLKGALVSGLTAGLTAGAGSVLRGAEWAVDGANLSHAGKAALAATSALTNAATNKLVGNPSGFSWASVAASAGTAAIASSLNLDGGSLFEGGSLDGDFGSDLIGGFARAGISYGISKGVFNKGSWNFENVASDVFGNAIGNSVVRSQTSTDPDTGKFSPVEQFEPQRAFQEAQSQAIGQIASSAVNQRLNNRVNSIVEKNTIDLTKEVAKSLPGTEFIDVTPLSSTAKGRGIVTRFLEQSAFVNGQLNVLDNSFAAIQDRIDSTRDLYTIREARAIDPIAAAEAIAKSTVTREMISGSTTLFKTSFEVGTGKDGRGKTIPKAGFKGQVGGDGEVKNSFVFTGDQITSADSTNAFGVTVNAENKRFSNTFLNENGQTVNETGGGTDFRIGLFKHENTDFGSTGSISVFGVGTEGKLDTVVNPITGEVVDVTGSAGGHINLINTQFSLEGTDALSILDVTAKVDANFGFGPGVKFVQQGSKATTERSLFRGKVQADVKIDINHQRLQNNLYLPDFVKDFFIKD